MNKPDTFSQPEQIEKNIIVMERFPLKGRIEKKKTVWNIESFGIASFVSLTDKNYKSDKNNVILQFHYLNSHNTRHSNEVQ